VHIKACSARDEAQRSISVLQGTTKRVTRCADKRVRVASIITNGDSAVWVSF
jgi:hypothetical protein